MKTIYNKYNKYHKYQIIINTFLNLIKLHYLYSIFEILNDIHGNSIKIFYIVLHY